MMVKVCYYQIKNPHTVELLASKSMAKLEDLYSGKIKGIPLPASTIFIDSSRLDDDGLYWPGKNPSRV